MKKTFFAFVFFLWVLILCTSLSANIFLVTNLNSSGAGSLSQAIEDANALAGEDTILFASSVRGTIYNSGVLTLTDGLVMIGPGPDLLAISSNFNGRVIFIDYCYGKNFLFKGLTFKDGRSTTGGGAGLCGYADTIKLLDCIVKDNESVYQNSTGGGIALFTTGSLIIENCLIINNSSCVGGSGITIGSETICTMLNTSICNNFTTNNAVYGGGGICCAGKLSMINCTISGNSHPTRAGAIYVYGFVNLTNCTVAYNYSEDCGGIYDTSAAAEDSVIILSNSIVYGNTSNTSSIDLYGRVYSKGHNLIGDQSTAIIAGNTVGNYYGNDPLLFPLAFYSSTALLHSFYPESPVNDGGDNILSPKIDQRGIPRPQDGNEDGISAADIGSFELFIDFDADGISDKEEKGSDGTNSSYDGNADLIPDYTQWNVCSFWNYNDEVYLTLATSETNYIKNVVPIENPSDNNLPSGINFPIGFIKFGITIGSTDTIVNVRMILPQNVSVTDYYKYACTTDFTMQHWYLFNYNSLTGAEISSPNIVDLHFIDGHRGDDDLASNGYIIDPGGPVGIITSVDDEKLDLPTNFSLSQNYPNPFNPSTKISWQTPVAGHLTIKLYDVLGNEIETIVDGYYEAGKHSKLYIAHSTLSSGVYFYQLSAGDYLETKKMILIH